MNSEKILVVDDSRLSRRRFLSGPLKEAGYEVIEAADGQEGLDAFDEHTPDLVISDLLMPVMDGFEFIAALREKGITQPVIVATADIQESSRKKVDELGCFGFLNKPYSKETLLETVENAIESVSSGAV
ncbi:MAG: response regulator [Planctomycetota bacterium]